MGLFGGGARALRRRVQRDLSSTPSWKVVAGSHTWICPFCAEPAIKRYPEDEEGRIEAVLQHLDGQCPEFRGGEGEEHPVGELRRTALRRELRAKVKKALVSNSSWQLIDIRRQWYCPFCADTPGVEIPSDRRMTEDVLQKVIDHIDRCYQYDHGRGEEKPLKKLKKAVKKANKTRKLVESVRRKLEGDPGWRRKDEKNCWVCPYCLKAQERIDLSSNLLMFENAPHQIAAHLLDSCKGYRAGALPAPLDKKQRPRSSRLERPARSGSGTETGPVGDPLGLSGSGSGSSSGARGPFDASGSSVRGSGRLPGWSDTGEALGVPDDVALPFPDEDVDLPPWDDEETGEEHTTLRKLQRSGEFLGIDESEVKSATAARTSSRADEWRREIAAELATVRGLAPASGEHLPHEIEGGPGEPSRLTRDELARRKLSLKTLMWPAVRPRGDFVEVLELGNGRLGLAVGGLATEEPDGPLVAAVARSLIRKTAAHDRCPGEVLKAVNQELFPELDGRNFFTCVYAILDMPTSRLRLCRAGSPPPLLMSQTQAQPPRALGGEGMMMGIDRGPIFSGSLEVQSVQLEPGDMLVLYGNGITEARAVGRDAFGMERVQQLVARYGRHEVAYFCDKFREYFQAFHAPPSRRLVDACLLALKRSINA